MQEIVIQSITSILASALLATVSASSSFAQQTAAPWPSKSITIVIGYPPGTVLDIHTRKFFAPRLSEALKQPVLVDNRPGATGQIGASYVATAPADGHVVLFGSINEFSIQPALGAKTTYDTARDFRPIALAAAGPSLLWVSGDSKVKSLADLAALAKIRKEPVTCGHTGVGSYGHLVCEYLGKQMNISILSVPYRGTTQALTAIIGGTLDIATGFAQEAMPLAEGNRIVPIAATSRALPRFPEAKALKDQGMDSVELGSWAMFVAPAATPQAVVERMNKEINAVIQSEEWRLYLANSSGVTPVAPMSVADNENFVREQTALWKRIVQKTGVKLE